MSGRHSSGGFDSADLAGAPGAVGALLGPSFGASGSGPSPSAGPVSKPMAGMAFLALAWLQTGVAKAATRASDRIDAASGLRIMTIPFGSFCAQTLPIH